MDGRRTLLAGGNVFDGSGRAPEQGDVLIEGGRIVGVGSDLDADDVVDVAGATVLPGFFDCHVHVMVGTLDLMARLEQPYSYAYYEAAANLRRTLHAGVTTARDAGGADAGVRLALQRGMIDGPRLQISVTVLSQTGGHGDAVHPSGICTPILPAGPGRPSNIVDGPDEMRRRVREVIRAGAEVIKVCTTGGVLSPGDDPLHSQFSDAELDAMMVEVRAAGLTAMAHAQGTTGIKNALRAGVRSIEHGIYLDDEAIEMMLDSDAWLVPTLSAPRGVVDAKKAGATVPDEIAAKAADVVEAHAESFRRAAAAGVRIAMGTDAGACPHGANLHELTLMAETGMDPLDVLRATTSSAADLMRVPDRGRIRTGALADLLIVDGEPTDFRTLPQRIREIRLGGVPVQRSAS